MTIFLRQSTASQEVPLGYFVDSTDGNTEETALTIANTDIKVWKTGATTLANKNIGGGTHISNGIYYAVLDATDTDTIGPLRLFIHVSGALAVKVDCVVLDEAVYDALFGTTALATATNITAAAGITLADGAITAAKIAAGAIDAAAMNVTGSEFTAIPWNAAWDAEVQSEVEDALVAHRLDELLNADSDIDGVAPPTVGSVFHELMSKTAGSFTFDQTTDSNEAIRDNMGTAQTGDTFARLGAPAGVSISADIAAIEAQTNDIGVAGAGLTALATQASVNVIDDFLDTEIAAIKAKTDSLTFTVAGQVDANIQSINDTTIVGNGAAPKFGV